MLDRVCRAVSWQHVDQIRYSIFRTFLFSSILIYPIKFRGVSDARLAHSPRYSANADIKGHRNKTLHKSNALPYNA
jgi:hypothetical protein